jgi:hypothetical protein
MDNTAYIIQEPPRTKGKAKHKKVQLPMTIRHTREDCVRYFVNGQAATNTEWRRRWKECYKTGFRCIKVKLIPA